MGLTDGKKPWACSALYNKSMFIFIRMQKAKFFRIVKVAIFVIFLFLVTPLCQGQEPTFEKSTEIINVDIIKNADSYKISNLEVVIGEFGYLPDFQFWKGKESNGCVMSFQDNMLGCFVVYGSLTVIECSDRMINDKMACGCVEKPEGEILIQLPYFPNGKYAYIYDSFGKKVLTIDLTSKATCNENGICNRPIEDSENCLQDCKNLEPKLDPALVEKAQEAVAEDKKISASASSWWTLLAGIVLLAIGCGIGYYIYRRNKEYL